MKRLNKVLVAALGFASVIGMTGCGPTGVANDGVTKNEDGTYTVRIGNTNAAALLPTVFGPMEDGFQAYAWYYSNYENGGKVKIDYKHLDDGYVAATRAVNTDQLLGADKCFGIVYGYDDQVNKIEEADKVMVYTPLTMDYYVEAGEESNALFPIQPIDYVEGKQLLASAFAKGEAGLSASKVGVIAGLGQTGVDELKGMRDEAKVLSKESSLVVQTAANAADTDYTASVKALKDAGCDVVLLTDVQLVSVINAIVASGWENVKILASYKFSNTAYLSYAYAAGLLNSGRKFYTTGWISAQRGADYDKYVEVCTRWAKANNQPLVTGETAAESDKAVAKQFMDEFDWAKDGVSARFTDSYTMAGYEGMHVFCQGITRLLKAGKLDGASTADYVKQMEKSPIEIPMSEIKVSCADGQRTGARAMTLVECTEANHTLGEGARTFYDIPALEKACK